MGAFDILSQLRGMGLTLSLQGEAIRAEPKAAINDEARALIRTHKGDLLALLKQPASATESSSATAVCDRFMSSKGIGTHARASLESINENCAEFFEERAAIMEYDGNLSREDAEAAARAATEK
nr:hypothetical protein [Burkholderiales bacterium]